MAVRSASAPVDDHLVAAGVDENAVDADGVALTRHRPVAAPEHRPQPGQEHPGAEGLGDIVVRAQLQPRDNVRFLPLGRDHDHREMLGPVVLLEMAADLQAVHAREHEVQEDEVGEQDLGGAQGLLPGGHPGHPEALLGKVVAQQLQDVLFVFHYQNVFVGHDPSGWQTVFCEDDIVN